MNLQRMSALPTWLPKRKDAGVKGVLVSEEVVPCHKAPLCKGGWRPQGDWGIVFI